MCRLMSIIFSEVPGLVFELVFTHKAPLKSERELFCFMHVSFISTQIIRQFFALNIKRKGSSFPRNFLFHWAANAGVVWNRRPYPSTPIGGAGSRLTRSTIRVVAMPFKNDINYLEVCFSPWQVSHFIKHIVPRCLELCALAGLMGVQGHIGWQKFAFI